MRCPYCGETKKGFSVKHTNHSLLVSNRYKICKNCGNVVRTIEIAIPKGNEVSAALVRRTFDDSIVYYEPFSRLRLASSIKKATDMSIENATKIAYTVGNSIKCTSTEEITISQIVVLTTIIIKDRYMDEGIPFSHIRFTKDDEYVEQRLLKEDAKYFLKYCNLIDTNDFFSFKRKAIEDKDFFKELLVYKRHKGLFSLMPKTRLPFTPVDGVKEMSPDSKKEMEEKTFYK